MGWPYACVHFDVATSVRPWAIYIYIYTSVNPRISILVSDETESRQAELSGVETVFPNSFFEQLRTKPS